MNKFKKKLREWHIWLGIFFSLPLILIGITTILLAHGKTLELEKYSISSKYFPGYWGEKSIVNDLKVYFKDTQGREYFGYKSGLDIIDNNQTKKIDFFEMQEIRAIAEFQEKIIIGTKHALFVEDADGFKKAFAQDIWSFYTTQNQLHIVTKDGMFISNDLNEFELLLQEKERVKKSITLKKLNLDLHTGKALFGKSFEWIWQDILAICLLFFVGSGFFLWYTKKSKSKIKEIKE